MQAAASHSSENAVTSLGDIATYGDIVAIVGAGGKTTTMFALAHALADRGFRVVTSKSTVIHAPSMVRSPKLIVSKPALWSKELPDAIKNNPEVTVVTSNPTPRRFEGIEPEMAPALLHDSGADVLIVEADGARRRLLKLPASHEPAMPKGATAVLPVGCLAVVGAQLTRRFVHRPELAEQLLGLTTGATLTPANVVAVLLSEQAGLKSAPLNARKWPVLTAATTINTADLGKLRRLLGRESKIAGWIEADQDWEFSVHWNRP